MPSKAIEAPKTEQPTLVVKAPNLATAEFKLAGTAPYVQHKFSEKARKKMLEDQKLGAKKKNRSSKQEGRKPEEEYQGAIHRGRKGRYGIPAPAFRCAMISACRLVGFTMTKAKLSVFVEPDDFDETDGTPLVHINGEPEMHEAAVRLESGVTSIAIRPMWKEWSTVIRVRYDADQFGHEDVANLLVRAGLQVGIGEGRHDSKKSNGMGWGTFTIENMEN